MSRSDHAPAGDRASRYPAPPMRAAATAATSFALLTTAYAQAPESYPEGAAIPRSLTAAERTWLQSHPLRANAGDVPTPPPTGPLHCAAEYEPCAGLVVAYEGTSGWLAVLHQIARHVTTAGQARIWCYVDSASERTTASAAFAAAGADPNRITCLVRTTDTIWARDYGPRYVFEGGCRAIVDHTYNRPRPNDDTVPVHFGQQLGHRVYELPLVHGGGNFHLDATGQGHATLLIQNENPTLSQAQIVQVWRDYQHLGTTLWQPFPTSVDATQHIDMWLQVHGDRAAVVSDWPLQPGSVQDTICDGAAAALAAAGWTITRVPAVSSGGVHYTFTNMVLCNDLALVPSYTNASAAAYNAQALAVWQAVLPGKTVVAVPCQAIVTAAGVMHCIVMHVPAPRGGAVPTAFLRTPAGGRSIAPGQSLAIEWLADDDEAVTGVDLLLSVDGGATFPQVLVSDLPPFGAWTWTVPDLHAPQARLRVVARDAQGQSGHDDSDGDLVLLGAGRAAVVAGYGQGKPGQHGTPQLAGTAPVLGSALTIALQHALPQALFLLLVGDRSASDPFDGGTLWVQATGGLVAATDAAGAWSATFVLPADPALLSLCAHAQAWVPNDPGAAGGGWAASAGVRLVLGP
jgi:agmatine deiminase